MRNLKFLRTGTVLGLIIAVLLLLAACAQANETLEPALTSPASSTLAPTLTLAPTATATLVQQPTATSTSTPTLVPASSTPSGPDIRELSAISSDNIARLTPIASVELSEGDRVDWSPSKVAFAISSPSGMLVYRLESLRDPIAIRYQSQPYFSADGAYLAARLENGDVQVWDLDQGTLVGEYSGLTGEVVHMAFSAKNDLLAAVSVNNQVLVWELATGEVSALLEVPEFVIPITYTYDLLFSPDEARLALFREGEALIWNIEGIEEPQHLHWDPPPASPAHGPAQFSPDWSAIAWSDRGSILVMDTASGEHLTEFERQVGTDYFFTRDWASLITIGYDDTNISVWDPFAGKAFQLLEHPETVFHFWISPDERYLASLTFSGLATLWDLNTGRPLAELSGKDEIGDWLAFSPQGDQLALLLNDGRISVWDVSEAVHKFTLDNQATRTFVFSPDGSLLVTVSSTGSLYFLNTVGGEQMLGLDLAVADVEFSPAFVYEGRLVALETLDSLQLWGVK